MERVPEETLLLIFHFVKGDSGWQVLLPLRLVCRQWLAICSDTTLGFNVDLFVEARNTIAFEKKRFVFSLTVLDEGELRPKGKFKFWCWYADHLFFMYPKKKEDLFVASWTFPVHPPSTFSASSLSIKMDPTTPVKQKKVKVLRKFTLPCAVKMDHMMKIWQGERMLVLQIAGAKDTVGLISLDELLRPSSRKNKEEQKLQWVTTKKGRCLGFVETTNPTKMVIQGKSPEYRVQFIERHGGDLVSRLLYKNINGYPVQGFALNQKGDCIAWYTPLDQVQNKPRFGYVTLQEVETERAQVVKRAPTAEEKKGKYRIVDKAYPAFFQSAVGEQLYLLIRYSKVNGQDQHKKWTIIQIPRQPTPPTKSSSMVQQFHFNEGEVVSFQPWTVASWVKERDVITSCVGVFKGLFILKKEEWYDDKFDDPGRLVNELYTFVTRKGTCVATIRTTCSSEIVIVRPRSTNKNDEALLLIQSSGSFKWITFSVKPHKQKRKKRTIIYPKCTCHAKRV